MPANPVRRLLPFAALAAATALVLSACAAPASEGEGDGELVWSIEGANLSAGHMDPQISQLDVSGMVQRAVLDSLVFQENDGTFTPWLAKEWEVSPDSTEYTFTLRDDVTFTDGEPFDAAAVKRTSTASSTPRRSRPRQPACSVRPSTRAPRSSTTTR